MIDIPGMSLVSLEETYRSVITARNKFLASWRELDTHDSCHMALQYVQSPVKFAHVEYIRVMVLVRDSAKFLSAII